MAGHSGSGAGRTGPSPSTRSPATRAPSCRSSAAPTRAFRRARSTSSRPPAVRRASRTTRRSTPAPRTASSTASRRSSRKTRPTRGGACRHSCAGTPRPDACPAVSLEDAMTATRVPPAALLLVALLALPAQAQPGPTQSELSAASSHAADWLHANHDYGGQRFVGVTGIDRQNVGSLRPVCLYQAGELRPFHTNPIVYRGTMYLTTSRATIALDAVTCRVRWRHDWRPKARENWAQNRGVAVTAGKVIRGTSDGYLLALDAETGRLLW